MDGFQAMLTVCCLPKRNVEHWKMPNFIFGHLLPSAFVIDYNFGSSCQKLGHAPLPKFVSTDPLGFVPPYCTINVQQPPQMTHIWIPILRWVCFTDPPRSTRCSIVTKIFCVHDIICRFGRFWRRSHDFGLFQTSWKQEEIGQGDHLSKDLRKITGRTHKQQRHYLERCTVCIWFLDFNNWEIQDVSLPFSWRYESGPDGSGIVCFQCYVKIR